MKDRKEIHRGTLIRLDGVLNDQQTYEQTFKPMLHSLWTDYQQGKFPKKDIIVEAGYRVLKAEDEK
jgi:hypothetical protein